MQKMTKEELLKVSGGESSLGLGLIIGGIVVLIAGIIDGYLRPIACNK